MAGRCAPATRNRRAPSWANEVRRPGRGIRPKARQTDRGCDVRWTSISTGAPTTVTGHHDASRRHAANLLPRRAVQFAPAHADHREWEPDSGNKDAVLPATGATRHAGDQLDLLPRSSGAILCDLLLSPSEQSFEASITGNDCNAARRLAGLVQRVPGRCGTTPGAVRGDRVDADSTSCK